MQAYPEDLIQTTDAALPSEAHKVRDDEPTCAEAAELEQLADRVSAARSVY